MGSSSIADPARADREALLASVHEALGQARDDGRPAKKQNVPEWCWKLLCVSMPAFSLYATRCAGTELACCPRLMLLGAARKAAKPSLS